MKQYLVDEFIDFFEKIGLTETQSERINSAMGALSKFLREEYGLTKQDVFVQGSFSTETVTKPAPSDKDGEYDVDLVTLCATAEQSPEEAIKELETIIESNGTYKEKIEKDDPKIPCIRLRYADEDNARFHVDIVPARKKDGKIIEIPRRGDGWELSNPQDYTQWVIDQGERYQRTLMFLRRWRDENEAPVKSIVLQVLAANCLSEEESDSENLAQTLLSLRDYLASYDEPPEVFNPVLEEEQLTKRWQQEDYKAFKKILDETCVILEKILSEESHDSACQLWQDVLGEDFLYQTDKEFEEGRIAASLGDISHVQPLIYPYRPVPSVSIDINAIFYTFFEKKRYKRGRGWVVSKRLKVARNIKSGENVKSFGNIDFHISVTGLKGVKPKIYWQVVNTGEEASKHTDLRGKIYPSDGDGESKFHYESTKYKGTHWIEFFAIVDGNCVARSGRFYVPIYHQR